MRKKKEVINKKRTRELIFKQKAIKTLLIVKKNILTYKFTNTVHIGQKKYLQINVAIRIRTRDQ